jgi:hypothetical protein
VHKFPTTPELVDEAPAWKFEPESGALNACMGRRNGGSKQKRNSRSGREVDISHWGSWLAQNLPGAHLNALELRAQSLHDFSGIALSKRFWDGQLSNDMSLLTFAKTARVLWR